MDDHLNRLRFSCAELNITEYDYEAAISSICIVNRTVQYTFKNPKKVVSGKPAAVFEIYNRMNPPAYMQQDEQAQQDFDMTSHLRKIKFEWIG